MDLNQVDADFNDAAADFKDPIHHHKHHDHIDLSNPSHDIVYFGHDHGQGWANYD